MACNKKYSDGGYGWLIVVSAFAVGFITDGIAFSFGILLVELLEQFEQGRAKTVIIISVMAGTRHCIGPLSAALCDRYGHRVVVITGSVVASTGFIISVFADKIVYITLTYGLLGGIGFGLMYVPVCICVIQTFKERRSLANGIAACGSGVGNICFSHLTRYLTDYYGWRGTVLLEAAIVLHGVAFGLLLYNQKPYNEAKSNFTEVSSNVNGINVNTVKSETHETNSSTCDYNANEFEFENYDKFHSKVSICETNKPKKMVTFNIIKRNIVVTFCKSIFSVQLLKDRRFLLFLLSSVMFHLAFTVPFNLLPDQGVESGMSKVEATWLITSLAITNTVGRVFIGMIGNLRCVDRLVFILVIALVIGLSTILSFLLTSFEQKLIYSSLYGFFVGVYFTLCTVVLADILDEDLISKSIGLLFITRGIPAVVATPLGGWLYDKTGSYDLTFLVAGAEFMLSAFFLLVLKLFLRRNKSYDIEKQNQ